MFINDKITGVSTKEKAVRIISASNPNIKPSSTFDWKHFLQKKELESSSFHNFMRQERDAGISQLVLDYKASSQLHTDRRFDLERLDVDDKKQADFMNFAAIGIQNLLLANDTKKILSPKASKPHSQIIESSLTSRGDSRLEKSKAGIYSRQQSKDIIILKNSNPEPLLAKDIKLPIQIGRARSSRGLNRVGYQVGLNMSEVPAVIRKGSSSDDKFTTNADTQKSPLATERQSFYKAENQRLFSITEPKFNSTVFSGKMSSRAGIRQPNDGRISPPLTNDKASKLRSFLSKRRSDVSGRWQMPTAAIVSLCRLVDTSSVRQSMILSLDNMRSSRNASVDRGNSMTNTQVLTQMVNRQPNPRVRSRVIQNNPLLRMKR